MAEGVVGRRGRRGPTLRRRLTAVGPVAFALFLLAAPLGYAGASPVQALPPHGAAVVLAAAASSPIPPPGAALPGSRSAGEPGVNAPLLALDAWESEGKPVAPPAASVSVATPTVPARPPTPVGAIANGTITGRIYDLTHGRPVVGALVLVQPFGTTICFVSCGSTQTNSQGDFTLTAPAGTVVVAFSALEYVDNRTWATVTAGGTIGLGTLYLIHDGYVTGIVEDNTPDQSPLEGVTITSVSRDGSIGGGGNSTAANGSFLVAVPPVPSMLTFDPPSFAFAANTTYSNVTPYTSVDLGIVHLEGGITFTADLVDAITGLAIASATPTYVEVCTTTKMCLPSLGVGSGPTPTVYGFPGPEIATFSALGYVDNATQIVLPDTNQTVDLGAVELVPYAAVELTVNITGGTASPTGWALPTLMAIVCSLSGLTSEIELELYRLAPSCAYTETFQIGQTVVVYGSPLYDVVIITEPPTPGQCPEAGFPLACNLVSSATWLPHWPYSYLNATWMNGTADQVTDIGSVDVTAGDYVTGNVSIDGSTDPSVDQYGVKVCSTDTPTDCLSGGPVAGGPAILGCRAYPGAFCAQAPPGPVEITVTASGTGTVNRTWVEVPGGCCAQDGSPLQVGWINLTGGPPRGRVYGTIVGQTGGAGSPTVPLSGLLVDINACPLSPSPPGVPAPGCIEGSVNDSGGFSFNASMGWDLITAQSTTYQGNWTWIDVTGNNSTGVIELAPKAAFIGQVLSPGGEGIYSAIISACPVGTPSQCYPLGTTNSFGQYNGSVPGGPLPWGTYIVMASSSGYATSWTYANSTPGALTVVPTFTLPVIGASSGAPGVPSPIGPAVNGSVGAWVDGRLADSATGYGVGSANLITCALASGTCSGALILGTAGGTFNASVLTGQYYLQATAPGYPATNIYINATSANVVHLGTVLLKHLPWVHGRVLIAPWASIADTEGLGAALSVVGCPPQSTTYTCGPAVFTDTGGFYNVSVPASGSSQVMFVGRGAQTWGSPGGGFQPGTITVATTTTYVSLPTSEKSAAQIGIFGSITGRLADGSTWNATDAASLRPCEFCLVITSAVGSPTTAYFITQTGGGGNYTVFGPSDGLYTDLEGEDNGYWGANESIDGALAEGATVAAPVLNLPHYGWVNLRAIDANSSRPVSYFSATAIVSDPANGTSFQTNGIARDDGFLNLSAPIGAAVTVNVSSVGYSWAAKTTSVRPSRTSGLGNFSLFPGASVGTWFRTPALNTVNTTPLATVIDGATHAPLPGVSVSTTTALGATTTTVFTNGLGQFLTFAPPQGTTGIYGQLAGYEQWVFHWVTANVSTITVQSMNMTGDGIVAGRVVLEPGGIPVYNTQVDVCPVSTSCANYGLTNATGVFWVTAPPGADTVSIVSDNYLTNYTVSLTVTTDRWSWIGAIPIFQFATITGTLIGIPNGVLLTDGNASVCSPFTAPGTTCSSTVPTDANGSFLLPVPPGTYVLQFQAPGYNTTYLPVDPQPGQNVSVGNIFLLQYGQILGRVVSTISGAPLANATVYACAKTVAGLCTDFEQTNTAGAFALSAPPGLDLLTTTASGFFDNYSTVYVPTGGATVPFTVDLLPLSVAIPESISGTVVAANRSDAPIPGAFVSAGLQGVRVGSGSTDSAGRFTLDLDWGTYQVIASAPGFAPVVATYVVHTNLTSLLFALPTMTYAVSGTVTDSLTGSPVPAVVLAENTTRLGITSAAGTFDFLLPNGTFDLVASSTSATGETYTPLAFTVDVAGHAVTRTIALTESSASVAGIVVDADSGLPIPTATVSVFGAASGARVALLSVSGTGAFSVSLAPGSYVVNVSAPGYGTTSVSVQVPTTTGPLTIALAPLGGAGPLGPAVPWPIVAGAAVGVVLAAVGLVLYRRRQPPPPPPPPRWTLEDLDEPDAAAVESRWGPGLT